MTKFNKKQALISFIIFWSITFIIWMIIGWPTRYLWLYLSVGIGWPILSGFITGRVNHD